MSYAVREIFPTIQGEGARAGSRSVFVRFAGCNLWDGLPKHRDRGAGPCARWCDTDFFRGDKLSLEELLRVMADAAPRTNEAEQWCVLTGGEPGLQVDRALVGALHDAGWLVAVETNGTVHSDGILECDHVCVSPKRGTDWQKLGIADEVKVILPGAAPGEAGWTDAELDGIEAWARGRIEQPELFVQPQDPIDASRVDATFLKRHLIGEGTLDLYRAALNLCIDLVMRRPAWRLSLQTHKLIGLP